MRGFKLLGEFASTDIFRQLPGKAQPEDEFYGRRAVKFVDELVAGSAPRRVELGMCGTRHRAHGRFFMCIRPLLRNGSAVLSFNRLPISLQRCCAAHWYAFSAA